MTGTPGRDDGLIEVGLVGHKHRYEVRVDMSGAAPRLVEIRISSPGDTADIDPAVMRVPVRRLARAAARFIEHADDAFATPDELRDQKVLARPEAVERRRGGHLGDDHYRRVAEQLVAERRGGAGSPRKAVAARFGVRVLTVDRWITEAKARGYLRRDWATADYSPNSGQDESSNQ